MAADKLLKSYESEIAGVDHQEKAPIFYYLACCLYYYYYYPECIKHKYLLSFPFLLPFTETPDAVQRAKMAFDNKSIDTNVATTNNNGNSQQQPEKETVTTMKSNKQIQHNPNNINEQFKQTNNQHTKLYDKRQNNCDNLRIDESEGNPRQHQMRTNVNSNYNRQQTLQSASNAFNDDSDDDPYAELESYLEKVKVSAILPFLQLIFVILKFSSSSVES